MNKETIVDLITSIVPYSGTAGVILKNYWQKQLNEKI